MREATLQDDFDVSSLADWLKLYPQLSNASLVRVSSPPEDKQAFKAKRVLRTQVPIKGVRELYF